MGRVPSSGNLLYRESIGLSQQCFDPCQFPGTQQAYRIGAKALSGVECPATTLRTTTFTAVVQVLPVKVELQVPPLNVDCNLTGSRVRHPQKVHAQRGIAQALANFAGG